MEYLKNNVELLIKFKIELSCNHIYYNLKLLRRCRGKKDSTEKKIMSIDIASKIYACLNSPVIIFRFADVQKLGKSVLEKDPKNSAVKDKLQKLQEDEAVIDDMWQKRMEQLQDSHDLQVSYYRNYLAFGEEGTKQGRFLITVRTNVSKTIFALNYKDKIYEVFYFYKKCMIYIYDLIALGFL